MWLTSAKVDDPEISIGTGGRQGRLRSSGSVVGVHKIQFATDHVFTAGHKRHSPQVLLGSEFDTAVSSRLTANRRSLV
jgi:hypothetical protein